MHACQVETVAQFGVIFLLFALGLEFSTTKVCFLLSSSSFLMIFFFIKIISKFHLLQLQLRVVRAVAVVGGLLEIILFMFLCGITAMV
jgi:Kef-type K+ transport system membrane component KefB